MESELQLFSIEQWYNRVIALDRNWQESKREEEKLKGRQEQGPHAPRLNNAEILRQIIP